MHYPSRFDSLLLFELLPATARARRGLSEHSLAAERMRFVMLRDISEPADWVGPLALAAICTYNGPRGSCAVLM